MPHAAMPGAAAEAHPEARRSLPSNATPAPIAAPSKVPVDLVSDNEGSGDHDRRASASAAGLGPSSLRAAAAAPTASPTGLHLKLKGLKCSFPGVDLVASDFERVEPGRFLNDSWIEYYMKHIEATLPPHVRSRCHFFSPFFMKKLLEQQSSNGAVPSEAEQQQYGYNNVKRWTKDVDIFAKDYVFVPIYEGLHYSVIVICHAGNVVQHADADGNHPYWPPGVEKETRNGAPLMLHLDSLEDGHTSAPYFAALGAYLKNEWAHRAAEAKESLPHRWRQAFPDAGQQPLEGPTFDAQELRGVRMTSRLPTQDNTWDCALFMLAYIEFFTAGNPSYVTCVRGNAEDVVAEGLNPDAADPATFLHEAWFCKRNAACLRDQLRASACEKVSESDPADGDKQGVKKKRGIAKAIAEAYERKCMTLGERYLPPKEFLNFARRHRHAPEPVLDAAGPSEEGAGGGEEGAGNVTSSPEVVPAVPTLDHGVRAASPEKVNAPAVGGPTSGSGLPAASASPPPVLPSASTGAAARTPAAPQGSGIAWSNGLGVLPLQGWMPQYVRGLVGSKRRLLTLGGYVPFAGHVHAAIMTATAATAATARQPGPSDGRDEDGPAAGADVGRLRSVLRLHVRPAISLAFPYKKAVHGTILSAGRDDRQSPAAGAVGFKMGASRRLCRGNGGVEDGQGMSKATSQFPVVVDVGTSVFQNSDLLQFANDNGTGKPGYLAGLSEPVQVGLRSLSSGFVKTVRSAPGGTQLQGNHDALVNVVPLLANIPDDEPLRPLTHCKSKKRTQAERDADEVAKRASVIARIREQQARVWDLLSRSSVIDAIQAESDKDPVLAGMPAVTVGAGEGARAVPLALALRVEMQGETVRRGVLLPSPALTELTRAMVRLLVLSAVAREMTVERA